VAHVHCPECGFQNLESANYCAKCGALLVHEDEPASTMTFTAEELTEEDAGGLTDHGVEGTALVVRSGGGRAGETFALSPSGRVTVGRSPDCEIFLDDVTVSRRHAELLHDDGGWTIVDQGSLNGTFVNRRRVESAQLEDGDDVQIGKYRLTFLAG
jgi:hypothetical protein